MKTPQDFKNAWQINKPARWILHSCGICGTPIGFVFYRNGEGVAYDSSCACVAISGWQESSWAYVADLYNMQTNPDVIAKLNGFWGFDKNPANTATEDPQ